MESGGGRACVAAEALKFIFGRCVRLFREVDTLLIRHDFVNDPLVGCVPMTLPKAI